MTRRVINSLYIIIFLLLGFATPLFAEDAVVRDMVVANSDKDLLLYFKVENAFTPEMEKGVVNGIPATFTFYVDLYRNRKGWPDSNVASHSFDRTLSYDNLKEEYLVETPELEVKKKAFKTLEEAKQYMANVNGFVVTALDNMPENSTYVLRVKVRLAKKTLPLNVHYLIPFWSLGDFETEYHSIEFKY